MSIPFHHHAKTFLLFENYVLRLNLANDYFIVRELSVNSWNLTKRRLVYVPR